MCVWSEVRMCFCRTVNYLSCKVSRLSDHFPSMNFFCLCVTDVILELVNCSSLYYCANVRNITYIM